jgi:hypothetical protein
VFRLNLETCDSVPGVGYTSSFRLGCRIASLEV